MGLLVRVIECSKIDEWLQNSVNILKKPHELQHFKQVYCKVSKLFLSKGVILF